MIPLSEEQIRFLLDELSFETVMESDKVKGLRVQQSASGYRDGIAGGIQAALSIALQVKTERKLAGQAGRA